MRNKEKQGGNAKRVLLIILCVFLALVLLAGIVLAVAMRYLNMINRDVDNSTLSSSEYEQWLEEQTEETEATAPTIDPTDVTFVEPTEPIVMSDEIINIMLIGQDRRPGEGRQRSDAMILCTINTKKKTVTLTSFMRDLYVQMPPYQPDKMNACYQLGGMELMEKCLMTNFGVAVDGTVEVDFSGFMGLVDMMGGVEIELNEKEANYLNRRGNWDFNDASAGTWSLTEGVNRLTGEQALAYSRIRYIGNGDFERTERQRKVLTALMNQCKSLSIGELNDLLETALPMLTTDLTNAEILRYAAQAFAILPELEIITQRVPADNTWEYATIREMGVIRMFDPKANIEMLAATMQEEDQTTTP